MSAEQSEDEPIPELEPMIDAAATTPQFAIVMRGYDRGQVDDHVSLLTEELQASIDRQNRGPAAREPYEGIGERIETMLRLAADEADSLREHGRTEAAQMVAAGQRQHDELIESGERDLKAVTEQRDAVVAELRRVQAVLATLGLQQEETAERSTMPR
jgi:hypothetical protein